MTRQILASAMLAVVMGFGLAACKRAPEASAIVPTGNLDRAQILDRYAAQTGRDVSHAVFYYVYGLFKNAIIALQIYARFRQGLTRDPRFGGLIEIIRVYNDIAHRAIDRGRVSHLFS